MLKKVLISLMITTALLSQSVLAATNITWEDDGIISISGNGNDANEAVSVIITDSEGNISFMDETKTDEWGEYSFKARVGEKQNLKVKVSDGLGSTAFGNFANGKDVVYLSENGNDSGDGSYKNPVKTFAKALEMCKEETAEIVLTGTIPAENITFNKNKTITIRNGSINMTNTDGFNIDANVKFENVDIISNANQTINVLGKAEFGKNITMRNPVKITGTDCTIYSGDYKSVSVKNLYISKNVNVEEISDCDNVAFLNGANYQNKVKGENKCLIKCGNGGSVLFEADRVKILPDDQRAYRIDGGRYTKNQYVQLQGSHSIEYEYDFKIAKIEADKDEQKINVSVIANNLNSDEDKNTPVLIMAVYEGNALQSISKKVFEEPGCYDESFDFDAFGSVTVKMFIWDSFKNIVPLTEYSFVNEEESSNVTEFYVAVKGDDANPGTIARPFKTIDAARVAARKVDGKKVVYIKGGVYDVTETTAFDAGDKDTVYKAYNDEDVVFTTAYRLKGSDFKTTTSGKDNIIDKTAREKVLVADVSAWENLGSIEDIDHGYGVKPEPSLAIDGKRATLAQYPNEGYVEISYVANAGDSDANNKKQFSLMSNISYTKFSKWKNAKDIVMRGYQYTDWAYTAYNGYISNFMFYSDNPYKYSKPTNNKRIKFTNLIEEIDVPGEWYLDRDAKKLWIYPTENWNDDTLIEFAPYMDMGKIFQINDSKNIVFDGLKFNAVGCRAINAKNVDGLEVKNCEFTNISEEVLYADNAYNCRFENNLVEEISAVGVTLNGGNTEMLKSGNNIISNNIFKNFAMVAKTYKAAVQVNGVGSRVCNNEISDAPHTGIRFTGQYHIIENNKISNVCNDTADSGAIYTGRDWTYRGNIIRNNYFSHINLNVEGGSNVNCVYLDDCMSSAEIYGNVFYDVCSAVLVGGGRDTNIENNIIIDADYSVTIDARGVERADTIASLKTELENSSYYRNDIWKNAFPHLYNILEDEPQYPKYNSVKNNVYFNSNLPRILDDAVNYVTMENNISVSDKNIFEGYDIENFMLKDSIPGFEEIPFGEIGIR